jgi:ribonuclease P/MRP protein subunit RPP1
MKDVIAQVKRAKDSGEVISVKAGDAGFNRGVAGLRGVHILRGVHAADRNAFDHVTAKMAADNGVAIDIDLSVIIAGRGIARQRAIQRYRDVLVLERRFEFPLTLSTYARSVLELRAVREISGLCSLLGMDIPDVERAFAGVERVTTPPKPSVRVIP